MVKALQMKKRCIDWLPVFLLLSGFTILYHGWEKNSHVWKIINIRGGGESDKARDKGNMGEETGKWDEGKGG
jgi:hypothetical protein